MKRRFAEGRKNRARETSGTARMCGRGFTRPSSLRRRLCTSRGTGTGNVQRPQPDASRTACELKHHGITPGRMACRRVKPGLRSTTEPAVKSLTREKKDPRNRTKQPGHPNPQGKSQQPSRRDQRRETAQTQRQESQNENEQDGHLSLIHI